MTFELLPLFSRAIVLSQANISTGEIYFFKVDFSQLGLEVNYHLYLGFKAQCGVFRSSLTTRSQSYFLISLRR